MVRIVTSDSLPRAGSNQGASALRIIQGSNNKTSASHVKKGLTITTADGFVKSNPTINTHSRRGRETARSSVSPEPDGGGVVAMEEAAGQGHVQRLASSPVQPGSACLVWENVTGLL